MEWFHNDFNGIMHGILNGKENKETSLIHFEVSIPVKKIPQDYIITLGLSKLEKVVDPGSGPWYHTAGLDTIFVQIYMVKEQFQRNVDLEIQNSNGL
jgi:hypothetical protein